MNISAKIGVIEITRDAIRILVLKTGGKRPKVLDAQMQPVVLLDDQDERDARIDSLRKAIGKLKSKPALYTLCAPSAIGIVRPMQIPFTGKRKVASAVPFELEPHLAFPIEELVTGHLTISESGSATDVLAVGLRRDALNDHLGIALEAGLSLEGVGMDAIGLTALWQQTFGQKEGAQAVLHIRPEEAILTIVHNGRLSYLHRVVSGATEFQANPRSAGRDVQNILRSYSARSSDGDAVSTLAVTGSRLLEAGRTLLENELDVAVEYHDLSTALTGLPEDALEEPAAGNDAKYDDANRWSALAGTALCAAGGPMAVQFDMSDADGKRTSASAMSSHALITATLVFACAVTYFGSAYLRYQHNIREADRVGQVIWDEYAATFPIHAQGKTRPDDDTAGKLSYAAMGDAIDAYTQSQASFSPDLFILPTPLDILREISTHMPDDKVSIQNISIQQRRKLRGDTTTSMEITIEGVINKSAEYQNVMSALSASPILELLPERQERKNVGGQESFEITLRTRTGS